MRYNVKLVYRVVEYDEVEAENEEQAIEIARSQVDVPINAEEQDAKATARK